jgi:hypothetical protein
MKSLAEDEDRLFLKDVEKLKMDFFNLISFWIGRQVGNGSDAMEELL